MPSFSTQSLKKLKTCNPHIQKVMMEAIRIVDFTIVSGLRLKDEQMGLYEKGRLFVKGKYKITDKSKIVTHTNFPDSRHNQSIIFDDFDMSDGIDITPYPRPENFWEKVENLDEYILRQFIFMSGVIMAIANKHNIKLTWGGDWKSLQRWDFKGRKAAGEFIDLPHYQEDK